MIGKLLCIDWYHDIFEPSEKRSRLSYHAYCQCDRYVYQSISSQSRTSCNNYFVLVIPCHTPRLFIHSFVGSSVRPFVHSIINSFNSSIHPSNDFKTDFSFSLHNWPLSVNIKHQANVFATLH